jgi:hypothetical protein
LLRLLTNIPLSAHIILLVLIPLLRLPTFNLDFLPTEESHLLMTAQRLLDGGSLYSEAWFAGPPVMVWIYYFFIKVFGSYALIAIRIAACFYLYISAIYFNGMILEHRIFRNYVGLKIALFVLMTSLPWYAQEVNASLFVLLPITISFHAFAQMGESPGVNYRLMFRSGVWMMICILATYKAVFVLLGLLLAYIWLKKPRTDEFLSLVGGMATVSLIAGGILFFNESLGDFWDVGVLFYLDRIGLRTEGIYHYDTLASLSAWLLLWTPAIILGLIGFFHFRIRFFNYITKIRSLELSMAVWFVGVLLVLIFKIRRLELADFILLAPPLSFYAGKIFDFNLAYRLRVFLVIITLAIPAYQYFTYWGIVADFFPNAFKPSRSYEIFHGGYIPALTGADPITHFKPARKIENGIWVMDYHPQIHQILKAPPANKYTDFRIAFYKFPHFDKPEGFKLLSNVETEKDIYLTFSENPPEYIIDPNDYLPRLQKRFPILFGKYQLIDGGQYHIYEITE